MRLLLDTCAFIWLAAKPARISKPAKAALDDHENELFLSDASIWEIVLKHGKGKLTLPEKPRLWIPRQIAFFQLTPVPLQTEALYRSGELPANHPDPFDRLLAAQSLTESFHLVSPDQPFRDFGVSCIW